MIPAKAIMAVGRCTRYIGCAAPAQDSDSKQDLPPPLLCSAAHKTPLCSPTAVR